MYPNLSLVDDDITDTILKMQWSRSASKRHKFALDCIKK